jgi:phospholipid/cholesterol/gamma-HCH transport system ATP-binding protein
LKLTSVVVTHDMRLAQKVADQVVFLHEGKVAYYGKPSEMINSDVDIVRDFMILDENGLNRFRDQAS